MAYYLVKLHPNLVDDRLPHHSGLYRERAEKENCVKGFYDKTRHIPLCVDHCNNTTPGFVVPDSERIGHIVDMFIDRQGQVITKLYLKPDHPEFKRITQSMIKDKQAWGASVAIDVAREGGPQGRIMSKELTHVALTTDPYFAQHNTFIRDFAPEGHEKALDRFVANNLYKENDGECFTGQAYGAKLKEMTHFEHIACNRTLNTPSDETHTRMSNDTNPSVPSAQPPPQQQQPPQTDADFVEKRQRLDNDTQGQTQARRQAVMPVLAEFDAENTEQVQSTLKSLNDWLRVSGLGIDEAPVELQDYYGDLLGARKQQHAKIEAQIRESVKHGFNPDRLKKIIDGDQRNVFYEMVACNGKAMDVVKARVKELEEENTKLKAPPQPVQYTQKSTARTPSAYESQPIPPRTNQNISVMHDASLAKIFESDTYRTTPPERNRFIPSTPHVQTYPLNTAHDSVKNFMSRM
jgi:hypothetical protein